MFDNGDPAYLSLFLVLLIMDVIIYGFQAAVNSVDEKYMERKLSEDKAKKNVVIMKYIGDSSRVNQLTSTIVTLIHVIFGSVFLTWLSKKEMIWIAILFIYIIICFGIMLPRKLAERSPERWIALFAGLFHGLDIMFTPFLALIDGTIKIIMYAFGARDEKDLSDVYEREIIDMVNEGHEQGAIEANEAELITNIFEYGDKEVQDIMTNRSNIVAIDAEMTLEDALQFMLEENYSRYPVCEDTIDNIVGILYIKDAMRFYGGDAVKKTAVSKIDGLLRVAEYVPPTRNIDDLFETMQVKKLQMAIVVDEFGQTAGLVTMEDIIEEIVGNIEDEYDEEEEFIEETSNDAYVMEGLTPLQDIEEQLGITFDDTECETLNGFMIGLMNHIPQEDEDFECEYKGYSFKVLSIENMRVHSVLVKKLEEITEMKEEN